MAQPLLVDGRRRVDDDAGVDLAARTVVPPRRHAAKALVRRLGPRHHAARHGGVAHDALRGERLRDHAPAAQQPRQAVAKLEPPHVPAVGCELDRGVEPVAGGVDVALEVLHVREVEVGQAVLPGDFAPDGGGAPGVWQQFGPVDDEQRPPVDADVARVLERRDQAFDVGAVVVGAVVLREEHVLRAAVPHPRPVLVGPAQAEGEVGLATGQHLVERPLEDAPAVEPVVVVDEAADAVLARQRRLRFPHLGHAQVVEAEIGWQMRLIVAREEWLGLRDVAPLREALAPPLVVLVDRMKLRQVEG